jgi:hypothetical protein
MLSIERMVLRHTMESKLTFAFVIIMIATVLLLWTAISNLNIVNAKISSSSDTKVSITSKHHSTRMCNPEYDDEPLLPDLCPVKIFPRVNNSQNDVSQVCNFIDLQKNICKNEK